MHKHMHTHVRFLFLSASLNLQLRSVSSNRTPSSCGSQWVRYACMHAPQFFSCMSVCIVHCQDVILCPTSLKMFACARMCSHSHRRILYTNKLLAGHVVFRVDIGLECLRECVVLPSPLAFMHTQGLRLKNFSLCRKASTWRYTVASPNHRHTKLSFDSLHPSPVTSTPHP
jgi:hypothetical protein